VVQREVIGGIVRHLPHHERPRAVDHRTPVEIRPYAFGGGRHAHPAPSVLLHVAQNLTQSPGYSASATRKCGGGPAPAGGTPGFRDRRRPVRRGGSGPAARPRARSEARSRARPETRSQAGRAGAERRPDGGCSPIRTAGREAQWKHLGFLSETWLFYAERDMRPATGPDRR